MSDPQIWTLIAVFSTVMIGGLTLSTTLINRAMSAQIGGLRGEMNAQITGLRGEMNARFEAVDARFDAVHSRFDAVDVRIEHLDRDVTALTKRAWGDSFPER
ncbi:hypothetical protein [Microbacterium sp. No. 7]|uniref:hypothetical protein n=1 Tax=Microbacterium sp. No. 7 TaxID=1714373 RepID=UPI0006CF2A7B|nr:hypothetical protein [Microbacterium sp. No. 7]ALJ18736.1 hypothetical protein AOA12_01930 [Microbacterium sp. No. 7]